MWDARTWVQQEFVFDFTVPPKKKKKVDYEKLYAALKEGPVSFSQIEAISGVSHACVSQVITTLSLRYPIYECSRGMYKLYGDDDYGDGINHAALPKEDL